MGIILELVDFDEMFAKSKVSPIIINDQSIVTEQDRKKISRATRTTYEFTDVFSNLPTCECGEANGGYNIGYVCRNCNTRVVEKNDITLDPSIWIRSPRGVESLVNPLVWKMLLKHFEKNGFSYWEWLADTDYRAVGDRPDKELEYLQTLGVQRGYNFLINNFEKCYLALRSLTIFSKKSDNGLHELIMRYRASVFCSHLPLPNKSVLVIEDTYFGKYLDPTIVHVLEAICNMQGIDTDYVNFSPKQKENRTAKTLKRLSEYHYTVFYEQIARKSGLIRKHILGGRCNFSTRAVISSITKPHVYDELELAWGQAVTLFGLHLRNLLMRIGMTPDESLGFLNAHTHKYHPLLDDCFKYLIENTKDKQGFFCIFVRNPTLTRSSTQRFRYARVKTDVSDQTTSMSIIATNGYNADFDGDAMAGTLLLDNYMSEGAAVLSPHNNVIDGHKPRNLSGVASISKPVAATIINWLMMEDREPDVRTAEQEEFLAELAC